MFLQDYTKFMRKVAILHAHVYLNTYLNDTYILCSYRVSRYICFMALIAIIYDCIGYLFMYTHVYYVHYSFFFQVNDRITHRSVNFQYNSRNVFRSIMRLPLYLITKEMPSNCMQKLKNVFTFYIIDYLYVQLTLHWNFYLHVNLRKLESSPLSVSFKVLLVSSDYSILYMLFIASRYFVFYFTFLYNAGPLSPLTYLLIHYALLFIINKLEGGDIIRVAWLNRNVVSLKKSIKNYNDELNYYTLIIIIYTLIISRPLFLGIILLILYIIDLSKYECTILHHSKQSHGTVNVGKFMCICFGGYTIKIVCIPLFCMCTQYTLIW